MKAISASIIVLSAAILIAVGGNIEKSDMRQTAMALGLLSGATGFIIWLKCMMDQDSE